jgi:hypothetical protein
LPPGRGDDLAERYGPQFGEPARLPDLIVRYGLTRRHRAQTERRDPVRREDLR